MDYELYRKIKKGNPKVFDMLTNTHLKKAWFLSYHLTGRVEIAAPLLIQAWAQTVTRIREANEPPRENFRELLHMRLLTLSLAGVNPDTDFAALPIPQVETCYQPFVEELQELPDDRRSLFLLYTYGNLGANALEAITGIPSQEVSERIKQATIHIAKAQRQTNRRHVADVIQLATALRSPDDRGFAAVVVPDFLLRTLAHELHTTPLIHTTHTRKDVHKMASTVSNPSRTTAKKSKVASWTAIIAVGLAIVILAIIFLPSMISTGQSSSITTYHVEAITTGDVDITISGSGTLTPLSKQTLVTTKAGTVTAVNYEVGATVEEGAVIATVKDSKGNTTEFTAPYDCVLLELPIAKDDSLAANSQIAMVMGTDGFSMGIAVDEQDIASVKVGQEVIFTLNTLADDYTGKVSAVSYNGTSSGGTTAFQIAATLDYIEGVYPGMSASAEIVIESSGEGLLVPTSAIRTSGDESYLYLAPADAEEGAEYQEDEISLDDLTKVTVATGMSDGSYTIVESDELSDGDLIVIVTLTSTQTGSDSEGGSFGGMGGMGFGGGRGEGGMNFGDFDFENFDPSNMPQGGFPGMGG